MYAWLSCLHLLQLIPYTVIATAVAEEGLDFPVCAPIFLKKKFLLILSFQIAGLRSCRSV